MDLSGTSHILGVIRDITGREQARREREQLEAQLRQSQKMEAIGLLAGGVAHDFNNVLAIILSYASLLMEGLKAGDPMFADLGEIKGAAERAAGLTRQLLAFSRQQALDPQLVELNDAVAGTTKMLRRLIGEDVRLTVTTLADPAWVVVDRGQMEQVLMNLAVNARDAMPTGGTLAIEVARAALDGAEARRLGLEPGPYVLVSVSDTGHGMDQETQAHIFEPFFTTKTAEKGTGLGLATVFGIVKQSGGQVTVESAPGQGATFRVWLPSVPEGAARKTAPAARPGEQDVGTETVLLVEDDDRVRKLAQTILSRGGYEVLEARAAGDALLLCEQYRGHIDLVLTDVVMPLMGGSSSRSGWSRSARTCGSCSCPATRTGPRGRPGRRAGRTFSRSRSRRRSCCSACARPWRNGRRRRPPMAVRGDGPFRLSVPALGAGSGHGWGTSLGCRFN